MPASRTYSPLTPQNPAESLQTNTCRYARYAETHPVQPLKGLREPRTASVSYRALAPGGETLPCGIKGDPSVLPKPIPNSKFLILHWTFTFSAKERDPETDYSYFGSRYYSSELSIWLSVDPQASKYPSLSPYVYCANNPIKLVDPNGEEWVDANGNPITDHSKIKVYIFYDPESFGSQSKAMYEAAEQKYGKGSVAMSNVTTMDEFAKDWGDMASNDIKEVNLNYHGNNQTIMLDNNNKNPQYITATGNGVTNKGTEDMMNVQDLPTPKGDISNAQLNLNTCKSNSRTQYELKGSKQTLMEAFHNSFNFQTVRGTSAGVSYNRFTKMPDPQWFFQSWDYMGKKPVSSPAQSLYTPNSVYYRGGHK